MKCIVSLAQMRVFASDPARNLARAKGFMREATARGTQLLVFPEMWTTGFNWTKNKEMAKTHEVIVDKVAEAAHEFGLWITGTLLGVNKQGAITNTSTLFSPQGKHYSRYDKTHLFSFVNEHKHVAPGASAVTCNTPWGTMGQAICYDLRFPELFRTYALRGAGMVTLPAAFPHPRLEHWKTLIRARAIENQMFMVAANQIGEEYFGAMGTAEYFGHSCVIDPWGQTLIQAGEGVETLLTVEIDLALVDEIRRKMHVFDDRRPDLYEL